MKNKLTLSFRMHPYLQLYCKISFQTHVQTLLLPLSLSLSLTTVLVVLSVYYIEFTQFELSKLYQNHINKQLHWNQNKVITQILRAQPPLPEHEDPLRTPCNGSQVFHTVPGEKDQSAKLVLFFGFTSSFSLHVCMLQVNRFDTQSTASHQSIQFS